MACCDGYEGCPEDTVGTCPKCGAEVDKDGDSTEDGCNYADPCDLCGDRPCDQSC